MLVSEKNAENETQTRRRQRRRPEKNERERRRKSEEENAEDKKADHACTEGRKMAVNVDENAENGM